MKTKNQLILPKEIQKQVAWLIQDYPRYVMQRNDILASSQNPLALSQDAYKVKVLRGKKAPWIAEATRVIDAVESSIKLIDKDYRKGVWDHCILGSEFPDCIDIKQYKACQTRFLFLVAFYLHLPIDREVSEADLLRYSRIPDECLKA